MTGLRPLLRLELEAMWKTWHRWALPLALPLLAAVSLLTSRFGPEIAEAVAGAGYSQLVPEPSWREAYGQWAKNLSQMGVFLVIFTGASATSSLISSGQAALLAVRPVSRAAQPVAAFAARAVVLLLATSMGAAALWILTAAVFPGAPAGPAISASAAWVLCACFMLALAVSLSAAFASTLGAAGTAVAVYVLFNLLSAIGWASRYTPAGLVSLPASLAGGSGSWQPVAVLTGLAAALALLAWAARSFARREL